MRPLQVFIQSSEAHTSYGREDCLAVRRSSNRPQVLPREERAIENRASRAACRNRLDVAEDGCVAEEATSTALHAGPDSCRCWFRRRVARIQTRLDAASLQEPIPKLTTAQKNVTMFHTPSPPSTGPMQIPASCKQERGVAWISHLSLLCLRVCRRRGQLASVRKEPASFPS